MAPTRKEPGWMRRVRERITLQVIKIGFDHGVGHLLLLLYDVKAPHCRKNKAFKGLGHYAEWPKVADAVIKAEKRVQDTWAMAGRRPRCAIARAKIGNARPQVVRACARLDRLEPAAVARRAGDLRRATAAQITVDMDAPTVLQDLQEALALVRILR